MALYKCYIIIIIIIYLHFYNKKHLKNVGPIRHYELPHAACFTLPFTRCRYCRTPPLSHVACASMSTTTTTTTTRDRGDRYGPMEWAQSPPVTSNASYLLTLTTELSYHVMTGRLSFEHPSVSQATTVLIQLIQSSLLMNDRRSR